jgi:hypothetical protein
MPNSRESFHVSKNFKTYLFSTRQVGNILPRLFGRHHTKQDALGKGIQTINKFQFCIATQSNHLVHFLETLRDGCEPRHEGVQTLLPQIIVQLLDFISNLCGSLEMLHFANVLLETTLKLFQNTEIGLRLFQFAFQCFNRLVNVICILTFQVLCRVLYKRLIFRLILNATPISPSPLDVLVLVQTKMGKHILIFLYSLALMCLLFNLVPVPHPQVLFDCAEL